MKYQSAMGKINQNPFIWIQRSKNSMDVYDFLQINDVLFAL